MVKHWLFYYFSTTVGGRDSFCRDLLAMKIKMPYGQNEQNEKGVIIVDLFHFLMNDDIV